MRAQFGPESASAFYFNVDPDTGSQTNAVRILVRLCRNTKLDF
jgi:hypothetical protein